MTTCNRDDASVLQRYGMVHIGRWVASDHHRSVAHLRGVVASGINYEIAPEWRECRNVVYAFLVAGSCRYVGETNVGLVSRFDGYRYGNPVVRDTDNRIKEAITEAILSSTVDIWASSPVARLDLADSSMSLPVSKPLQDFLIEHINPDLNVGGVGNAR